MGFWLAYLDLTWVFLIVKIEVRYISTANISERNGDRLARANFTITVKYVGAYMLSVSLFTCNLCLF